VTSANRTNKQINETKIGKSRLISGQNQTLNIEKNAQNIKSVAYLIQRAIYQRGLQRTQFFSKPFTDELKKETDKIVKAFADDLELAIEQTLEE